MAQAFWQRGAAYARKGDHTRAIAEYDEAIRQDPKFSRAYWSRGNSYEFKGDYDKAIADYDEAVRLDPKWANAYYDRGVVYAVKGDLERAVADYSEAIRLNPIASYYWRRGVAYSMRGANEQAIKDFDEALRLNPKLATAYWQRGVAHANAGDLPLPAMTTTRPFASTRHWRAPMSTAEISGPRKAITSAPLPISAKRSAWSRRLPVPTMGAGCHTPRPATASGPHKIIARRYNSTPITAKPAGSCKVCLPDSRCRADPLLHIRRRRPRSRRLPTHSLARLTRISPLSSTPYQRCSEYGLPWPVPVAHGDPSLKDLLEWP